VHNVKNSLWKILRRSVPYAIFSWRYLLPGQSQAVKLHKEVFLRADSNHLRTGWWVIAFYNYGKWYLFQGGISLFKTRGKYSPVLYNQAGISRKRQFADLLRLVFLHTTPAVYYYHYRLYRYSYRQWFDFIYTFELPSWHRAISPHISPETEKILSDKNAFAQKMQKQGFPIIEGKVISKGSRVSNEQLFRQSSLFLKPLCGSRQEGIFRIRYQTMPGVYSLIKSEDEEINDCERILSFVQSLINEQDYLIQPLLKNHPELQAFSPFENLITIRLITIWTGSKAKAVSAILELPKDAYSGYVYALPVDIKNGMIKAITDFPVTYTEDMRQVSSRFSGRQVIYWNELVDTALRAHANFPDLFSIGWDLAVTPEGVKLIEGNINWAVALHQIAGPDLMPEYLKTNTEYRK
jgi:hypothetical protein